MATSAIHPHTNKRIIKISLQFVYICIRISVNIYNGSYLVAGSIVATYHSNVNEKFRIEKPYVVESCYGVALTVALCIMVRKRDQVQRIIYLLLLQLKSNI